MHSKIYVRSVIYLSPTASFLLYLEILFVFLNSKKFCRFFAVFIPVTFAPNSCSFFDAVVNFVHSFLTLLYLLQLSSSKFPLIFFNWFSQFVLCCRFSFATFFMYLIVNFLTSCFKTFHFNWCLKRYSFLLEKVLISVISFCSVVKELSNFQNQNPLPLIVVFFFWKKEEYRRMICWNRRQYLCHGYKSLKSIRN